MYSSSLRLHYSARDCLSSPQDRYIVLNPKVANLSSHSDVDGYSDFGGIISSFSCFSDQNLGLATFHDGYRFEGGSVRFQIPASGDLCLNLDKNTKSYSYSSTPGMDCFGFA